MSPDRIEALVLRLAQAGIAECEYEAGSTLVRLRFRRSGSTGPAAPIAAATTKAAPATSDDHYALATATGWFTATHPLEHKACVQCGEQVVSGQLLGYLRIGDVLCPLTADRNGRVFEQLEADDRLVGYGKRLYRLGDVDGK